VSADILPDSRARTNRGSVRLNGVNYIPIYCANCGKRYGMVPEQFITHVTALCDKGCSGQYGALAHHYVDADAAFRADAAEEVAAVTKRLGRSVTHAELDEMAETHRTLSALARDWRERALKER
jgi:hypothetical protein